MQIRSLFLGTVILVLAAPLAAFSASEPDAFSVEFAYRDASGSYLSDRRTVALQGQRARPSQGLETECGATGGDCTCDFYRSAHDQSPVTASSVGLSQQSNSFSCVIPASITDAQVDANYIRFVRIRRTDLPNRNTGLVSVKTALTLRDVLGANLNQEKVRGIFRYSCSRTFFEGEGVSTQAISCLPGQHLGVITARYNFYTYRSAEDSNNPGGDVAFPDSICGRNSFLKIQCTGNTPELRYGYYKRNDGPFNVAISMTRAPEGDNLTSVYGFAAQVDSAGNCPPGLVRVRPLLAMPASITEGSIDGTNPSSNFINSGNALNNTVVEPVQPLNFEVNRQPNLTPCANDGNCSSATFNGVQQVQNVSYVALSPVVCAIPANLLGGIF